MLLSCCCHFVVLLLSFCHHVIVVVMVCLCFPSFVVVVFVVVAAQITADSTVSVAINLIVSLQLSIISPTLCAVPVRGSMKCFSSLPAEFFTINSIHLSHRRSGILVRTQNQTKAFVVTVPPLIAVQLEPQ